MERMLEKMANQLVAYDEASLMQLWQRYASKVREFEPTKEWEIATLIFSMIQAVRWKNQLFNYNLAATIVPDLANDPLPFTAHIGKAQESQESNQKVTQKKQKATVLRFPKN